MLLPLYMLVRHDGLVARVTRWHDTALGLWGLFAYHFIVALPLGLATGNNINFMLCPTDSLRALLELGLPRPYHWPTYHTVLCAYVPVLGQLFAVAYLAAAAAIAALRAAIRGPAGAAKTTKRH